MKLTLWCIKAKHKGFQSHFRTTCTVESYWTENQNLFNSGGTRYRQVQVSRTRMF